MNTAIIFISAIIAFCLFFPVYYFYKNGKSRTSRMEKLHLQEAAKYNLNLKETENWADCFIGIDPDQNTVLFIKTTSNENHTTVIKLKDVKHCNVIKKVKPIKTKNKTENLLEKVALEFIYFGNNRPNVTLEFYDSDGDYREDYEIKRAEKWSALIYTQLATLVKASKVA
jgi:hypothetical protein